MAIYVTAEDDAIGVQPVEHALRPIPGTVGIAAAVPAVRCPLFADHPSRGRRPCTAWTDLERQLKVMAGTRLVVLDPCSRCVPSLNVPETPVRLLTLAALAASGRVGDRVASLCQTREASSPRTGPKAIRGTGGLVDRYCAVALWHPKEDQAKKILRGRPGEPFERGRVR